MPPRKRLPFATLFTIVALTASGAVNYQAKPEAPKARASLSALAPAALPFSITQSLDKPGRPLKPFRAKGELPPASFVPIQFPIQFKDPKDLGVGKLLVAGRGLDDPNFARTVVLLVHYDEKGVLGLVLNRRTDLPLSRVLDLQAAKDRADRVYVGGPVELSSVFGLYQSPAKIENAEDIFGGVYLISDKDLFEKTMSAHPDPGVFHVYLGYAGWTQDQLRAEVKLGAWFVFPADAATVFNSDPDSLWPKMIEKTELHWAKTEPSPPAALFP